MLKVFFNRRYWLCTIFIYVSMWVLSMVPFPSTDLLDPVGAAFSDFDVTDVVFSKIRKYKSDTEYGAINDEQTDTNVVIVNIGELSRGEIGQLLHIINKQKPAVVGIDAFFRQPKDSLQDAILASACQNTDNLVLVGKVLFDSLDNYSGFEHSHPMFSSKAVTAYANLITAGTQLEQKTCRTFAAKEKIGDEFEVAFPVQLAYYKDSAAVKELLSREEEVEIINYVGNIDINKEGAKFYAIDFPDVFEGNFAPDFFTDKIVIMGFLGRTVGDANVEDRFYSPLNDNYIGKAYPDMYGVVIHANIIHMVLHHNYINVLPGWLSFILGIFICYFCIVVLHWFFVKYALLYGTTSKFVQLFFTAILLTATVCVFYLYNYKLDFDYAIIAVLLSADLMEIYVEYLEDKFIEVKEMVIEKYTDIKEVLKKRKEEKTV